MKYRVLDLNGDYTFGRASGNHIKDTPETVAQAVRTRLGLIQGEWFLNTSLGTPYNSKILGAGMVATYDRAIQEVILKTRGVKSLVAYSSSIDPTTRAASVNCTIDTIYGSINVNTGI